MFKASESTSSIYIGDDKVEIGDEQFYQSNIIPKNEVQLKRPIRIGRSAKINGRVFGDRVELLSGFSFKQPTDVLGVYGNKFITLHDYCRVAGNVQSNGEISIGTLCIVLGDVIGTKNIDIKDETKIRGNVIGSGDINIGNNVEIGGYIISLNGSVAIGDNSRAYDIIANNDICFGNNVVLEDPVVWTKNGMISLLNIKIAGNHQVTKQENCPSTNEINPYYNSSKVFEMKSGLNKLKAVYSTLYLDNL